VTTTRADCTPFVSEEVSVLLLGYLNQRERERNLSLFPHFPDEMDAASHGQGRECSAPLSFGVTWHSFLAAGGRNHFLKTTELTDLPTEVMSIVAVTGTGLYPLVRRSLEGPASKGTRTSELKGKDDKATISLAHIPSLLAVFTMDCDRLVCRIELFNDNTTQSPPMSP